MGDERGDIKDELIGLTEEVNGNGSISEQKSILLN